LAARRKKVRAQLAIQKQEAAKAKKREQEAEKHDDAAAKQLKEDTERAQQAEKAVAKTIKAKKIGKTRYQTNSRSLLVSTALQLRSNECQNIAYGRQDEGEWQGHKYDGCCRLNFSTSVT